MERAIRVVTARHEALRTCSVENQAEAYQAYQKVMNSSPLRLEHKKIESVEDVAAEYTQLKKHVFDIESGKLIRLVLLSLSPSSHYLLVNYHHILMDGVCSMLAIMRMGGIYVPLDLRNPMSRLAAVAGDCEPSAVLADNTMVENVSQLNRPYASVVNVSR